jgi:hypothetical protein
MSGLGANICAAEFPDKMSENPASTAVSDYVHDFLATRDGIELAKAFSRIEHRNVRRAIVELVEQIVPE